MRLSTGTLYGLIKRFLDDELIIETRAGRRAATAVQVDRARPRGRRGRGGTARTNGARRARRQAAGAQIMTPLRRIYRQPLLLRCAAAESFRDEFADEMTHGVRRTTPTRPAGRHRPVARHHVSRSLRSRCGCASIRRASTCATRSAALLRQKTFTLTAVTTFALALGPATAVVQPDQRHPARSAAGRDATSIAWSTPSSASPERNRHEFPWSELNFLDHRARKQGLSALGAIRRRPARRSAARCRNRCDGAWVSEDMFDVLGVQPARGRASPRPTCCRAPPPVHHSRRRLRQRRDFPAGDRRSDRR